MKVRIVLRLEEGQIFKDMGVSADIEWDRLLHVNVIITSLPS